MTKLKSNPEIVTVNGDIIDNDGINALKKILGGEEKFLEFAIKNVFFLAPIVVKEEWEKSQEEAKSRESIRFIRKSSGKTRLDEDNKKILAPNQNTHGFPGKVYADHDGNTAPRKLFKNITGVLTSYGKRSDYKNYTLTHIWGLTDNPYAFSAPWNICLTSTFIAALTDGKHQEEDRKDKNNLRYKFQAIFRAMAWDLYKDLRTDLEKILLPDLVPDEKAIENAKKYEKFRNVIKPK